LERRRRRFRRRYVLCLTKSRPCVFPYKTDTFFISELGEDGDEGDDAGLDEAQLAKLAQKAKAVNPVGGRGFGNNDDDDDDSDDDGMLTDDENVTSPLDDVDPFILFQEMMRVVSGTDLQKFNSLNVGVDPSVAQALMAHAEVRKMEIVTEAQEKEKEKMERCLKLGAGAV
jgi:hypothetical protein